MIDEPRARCRTLVPGMTTDPSPCLRKWWITTTAVFVVRARSRHAFITGVDPETTPRLYNSLIGTKFKVVTGYNSTAQIALAVERGEVQGIADWSWSSLKAVRPNWLADKQITLLMQGALKNEPELGPLPNALDFIKNDADRKVLELHFTQKTAARPLVTPPEVPRERNSRRWRSPRSLRW